MKLSVIICTKDRPKELQECLGSVINQTIGVFEVIVVDSSTLTNTKLLVENFIKENPNFLFIYKPTSPSLVYQRNVGVGLSSGDILLFLDDDVILYQDYIQNLLQVYKDDKENLVGGVEGEMVNYNPLKNLSRKRFLKFFMLPRNGNGKMQPSGFPTMVYNSKEILKVERLDGFNASYRRKIFDTFHFDENLSGYSYMEDDIFSYAVSKKFSLYHTPYAKLIHKRTSVARDKLEIFFYHRVYNHYYFFKKHMKKSLKNIFCFFWSNIGIIIESLYFYHSFKVFRGTMKGVQEIIKKVVIVKIIEPINFISSQKSAGNFWDHYASHEVIRWKLSSGYSDIIKKELQTLKPSSLLDLGCGPGRLFRLYRDIPHVVAIDISQKMLHLAKDLVLSNIILKHMSVEEIDFSAESFDMVLSCKTLQHISPSHIEEAARRICFVAKKYILLIEQSVDTGQRWAKHEFRHDYVQLFNGKTRLVKKVSLASREPRTELFLFKKENIIK